VSQTRKAAHEADNARALAQQLRQERERVSDLEAKRPATYVACSCQASLLSLLRDVESAVWRQVEFERLRALMGKQPGERTFSGSTHPLTAAAASPSPVTRSVDLPEPPRETPVQAGTPARGSPTLRQRVAGAVRKTVVVGVSMGLSAAVAGLTSFSPDRAAPGIL